MPVDNSKIISTFVPESDDGDTFIYTEMLGRRARKGNNGYRLMKSFYHRSQDEFWEQWPSIKELAELTGARAYTRLAPRSFKRVGQEFTKLVVEASLAGNWTHMKALYNSACGRVSPNQKIWLFDVDAKTEKTEELFRQFHDKGLVFARIPSRKGEHWITSAFDLREWAGKHEPGVFSAWGEISLHKDNPTNLYIPDEAK